jgi:hypothetical protein
MIPQREVRLARQKKDPKIYNDWLAEHRWEFDLNEASLKEVITEETIRQAERFDIAVPPRSDESKWEEGINNTRFLSREAVKELRAATRKARHETIEWRVKVWAEFLRPLNQFLHCVTELQGVSFQQ